MPNRRHTDAPNRTSARVRSLVGTIDKDRGVAQSVAWSRTDGERCSRGTEAEQSVLSGENRIIYRIPGAGWVRGGHAPSRGEGSGASSLGAHGSLSWSKVLRMRYGSIMRIEKSENHGNQAKSLPRDTVEPWRV